jgi:hypothetical protein
MEKPIQELAPRNNDYLNVLFDMQKRSPLDFLAFTRYIYDQIIILTKLV